MVLFLPIFDFSLGDVMDIVGDEASGWGILWLSLCVSVWSAGRKSDAVALVLGEIIGKCM